jgi:hypothetical protein
LEGLTELEALDVSGSPGLFRNKVTDAGLRHLVGLPKLRTLYLHDTEVTASGVNDLKQAVPNLAVFR